MKLRHLKVRENSFLAILLSIFLSILLFFILNLSFELATNPDGIVINKWNRTFPFYERINSPSKLELESEFILNSSKNNLALVFPKVIANRLEIYVNGYFIGAFGDKTGNIWPKALVQELPKWVLKESNNLRIVLYGTVGYGMSYYPYITEISKAKVKALTVEILRNNISLIALGAAIIISYILLFAFAIVDTHDKKMYLNIGLAMVFTIFSLIQFVYRETSGTLFAYLIFEKMALVFPIFGLTLIYFGLNESIPRKVPKFRRIVLVTSPVVFALCLFASNRIQTINTLSSLTEFYAVLLIFLTLFLIIRYKMVQYYFPIIFLSLTSLQTLYVLINNSPAELMIVYGRIVFSLYIGTFTIRKFKNISEIKKFLEQENLIDKLTGAYNRKIIEYIRPGGTLIILDLDNFKEINDKYGHIYGDELLKRFAEVIKRHIRQGEDYFIRLGGDEFCIITNSLDVETMMERIYNTSKNELGLSFCYGYAPMKNFDEAYAVADKVMYEKKALLKKQR